MKKLTGIVSVVLGAASYGVLATVVKFGNSSGVDASVLTFLQYFIGFVLLLIISLFLRTKGAGKAETKSKLRLVLFGTSLGVTSCFYYLSIQYIPVSIAIVLLMQAIWMGNILEWILDKTKPDRLKIIGSIVVLIGTLLAVNIFANHQALDFVGVGFGLLASVSYTVTLTATNRVENKLPVITRSKYLVFGGLLVVVLFWNMRIINTIDLHDINIYYFGIFLALFGCLIPPILFNKGFPVTGIGLGSILSAIEIPVSILSARIILDEKVRIIQLFGVLIIIVSVIMINFKYLRKKET